MLLSLLPPLLSLLPLLEEVARAARASEEVAGCDLATATRPQHAHLAATHNVHTLDQM